MYHYSLVENKKKMVDLGVDDKLIDMMNVETFPVVFKLLGTLRMLLDKQGLYVKFILITINTISEFSENRNLY